MKRDFGESSMEAGLNTYTSALDADASTRRKSLSFAGTSVITVGIATIIIAVLQGALLVRLFRCCAELCRLRALLPRHVSPPH